MKRIVLILICLSLALFIYSQSSCLPEGINFNNQDEINSFQSNYPGCTEIEGDVWIAGDIENLDGLNVLTTIGGELIIGNDQISTSDLSDLSGLYNLISIGEAFWITNTGVNNLSGLENLTFIGGMLLIELNDNLTDISSLENLNFIDNLQILSNNSLTTLTGLDNINPNSLEYLQVTFNNSLSTCNIESICDYLATPNADVFINYNSTGCNSPDEVIEACLTGIGENNGTLTPLIFPNPSSNANISLKVNRLNNLTLFCVNIYGQPFYQKEIKSLETTINISSWQPGIYFVFLYENRKLMEKTKVVVLNHQ